MEIYASSRNFEAYGINQEEWENENQGYILKISPPVPGFEYTLYTIVLVDADFETPPSWLKKNTHFIEYDLSMTNIENEHIINDEQIISIIQNKILSENCAILSLSEMKKNGAAFNVDSYQTYMSLFLNSNDLSINIVNDYSSTANCYSYPFFKSIFFNNPGADIEKCRFYFVKISIDDNQTIAFKVNFGNGLDKYYDYTDKL